MNRILIHRRAQQLLPAGIETCGLLQFGLSPVQAGAMLLDCLFGREAQGAVVLRLAASTRLAIQRQGLVLFAQARVARGRLPGCAALRYAPWRQLHSGGAHAGGERAGVAYAAAAEDGRAWLAVLPVERQVLCGWVGRRRAGAFPAAGLTGLATIDCGTITRCKAGAISGDHDHWPARRPAPSG